MSAAVREHVVVVGASTAGHAAAERLRESGFTGRLTIIGDEPHHPYNRTPLSKQLLTGEYQVKDLKLPIYTDLDATWRLGTPATGLDTTRRVVTLHGGEEISYDGLVIATGTAARALPGAPMHHPRVHMLRSLEDAHEIDQALGHSHRRVLVIGGGFIGCELASTCRKRGLDVTIVDVSSTLLTRALGHPLGAIVGDIHRDAGVRLHLGTGVSGWDETGKDIKVLLEDGEILTGDAAVVGIGTVPRVEWLRGAGLDNADGVLTSATCHAVTADGTPLADVVVAGDVARWPNPMFGPTPHRVEHWINAIEMGQAAADNLLAGPEGARPFTPVPRFWSEQHGVKIQSIGMPTLGSTVRVLEGTAASRRLVAAFTEPEPGAAPGDPERLMGVVALDDAVRLLDYAPLVGTRVKPNPASPTITLASSTA